MRWPVSKIVSATKLFPDVVNDNDLRAMESLVSLEIKLSNGWLHFWT